MKPFGLLPVFLPTKKKTCHSDRSAFRELASRTQLFVFKFGVEFFLRLFTQPSVPLGVLQKDGRIIQREIAGLHTVDESTNHTLLFLGHSHYPFIAQEPLPEHLKFSGPHIFSYHTDTSSKQSFRHLPRKYYYQAQRLE